MRKALRALKKHPEELSDNHNERKSEIKEVMGEASLIPVAEMLRDLAAREAEKKLNPTEQGAFEKLKERFVREWSIAMGLEVEEVREKLNDHLEESLAKIG
jgi:RNA polymerase-interacting CarD/CdnL/TRCF family regulator